MQQFSDECLSRTALQGADGYASMVENGRLIDVLKTWRAGSASKAEFSSDWNPLQPLSAEEDWAASNLDGLSPLEGAALKVRGARS